MATVWRATVAVALAVAVLGGAGCDSLPAGRVAALHGTPHPSRVILLRGWRGLYSSGVNDLAAKLRARGVDAIVYRHDQWRDVAAAVPPGADVTLVGFSYGADDAIRLADRLGKRGVRVPLLVTIDPVTPPPVPEAVGRCVNYYQSNGVMDVLPWLRGVPVRGPRVTNFDLRTGRKDLLRPDTSHATIAGHAKLHDEIVRLIVDAPAASGTLR